ncbi:MAG: hypothetical protein K2N32_01930 [Clostridia bacterium]|nr:hypothetical protein [Clostridia bacterium]
MDKKKRDMLIYQWLFFIPFSALAVVGIIAVGIVALLIFVCSAKYVVASFMLESAKIFPAILLTLICLGVVAVLVYSEVLLVKKYIKAAKEFVKEKNGVLQDKN